MLVWNKATAQNIWKLEDVMDLRARQPAISVHTEKGSKQANPKVLSV